MIIAAAEPRIRVVEFDLVGCFGWDDGEVTLAAGAEGAARTVAARCGESCNSGGAIWILRRGGVLSGTLLDGTMTVAAFPGGIGSAGTVPGET